MGVFDVVSSGILCCFMPYSNPQGVHDMTGEIGAPCRIIYMKLKISVIYAFTPDLVL